MKQLRIGILVMALGFLAACTPTPQSDRGLEPQAAADDLVITGVIDGPLSGGVPKAIELYAVNDIPDLSIYGLGSANNGGGSDGQEFNFPAQSLNAGDFIFVASDSTGFTDFFGFAPTFTSGAASINGDDAIELFTDGTVTDVFGDIGTDGSGEPWEYQDGWAYRSAGTGPDGTTFVLGNWSFSGPNALDGETTNASAATPFPLCSYAEGNCGAAPPPPPPTGDLVINEIHADPDSGLGDANGDGESNFSADEFVEIVNVSGAALDLSGWTLSDGFGVRHVFPADTVIADQCAVVVFGGGTPVGSFGDATVQTASEGSMGLNNGGDSVTLDDGTANRASVQYGGEGGDNQSLTLSPDLSGTTFVKHTQAEGSDGTLFSPGTQLDGTNFSGCAGVTFIHDIQGDGDATPLDGQTVTVEGVVVGDFQENDGDVFGTDLDGFFVQEEDADADTNPATSEGIFVFAPNAPDVSVGDLVSVTGTAGEFRGATQLSNVSDVSVLESGVPLPTVTDVTLPIEDDSALEAVEGMYVRFPQQLAITEYFNFDRFGEIVLALPLDDEGRLYQPTAVAEPGSSEAAARDAYNASARITLDDGRTSQNPDPARHPNGAIFDLDNRFRGGDLVQNTVGILSYGFGQYRIQPTAGADYIQTNPRPATPEDVGGSLKVASFNVLNYFNGDGAGGGFPTPRGADDLEEFARQEAKIVSAIIGTGADIVGLIEIENDPAGERSALDDLTEALNAAAGAGTYAYIETGMDGTDAIKVAFVYKPDVVVTVGDAAVLEDESFTNPRDLDTPKNRPALAQTFAEKATGGVLTVVVNHFKSKGSECGAGDDDLEQGSCNLTRTLAAEVLADWLAGDPTVSGDADVLIIGDLNAYDKEDPIDALKGAGYTDLILQEEGELAYSFVFSGQFGYLDYALANGPLLPQVTGVTEWHINADEPDILDYDTSFKQDAQDALFEVNPYRSSDHDPVIVGHALSADADVLLDALENEVAALRADGTLNRGRANALSRHLRNVERSLSRGNANAARSQLNGLENQLRAFRDNGTFSSAQAEHLLCLTEALGNAIN